MGGKSRKTGGVSKRLIAMIKSGNSGTGAAGKDCGKKKPTNAQDGFDFTSDPAE